MIERTLVLVKPDGVERGLVGEIIKRFEQRGLKIVALKMNKIDKKCAQQHYTEDITKRRGQHIRERLLEFLTEGPVVAMVIEGVNAMENVRKIVGDTEPKAALPGTIRGDFAHVSYHHADTKKTAIRNLVHASSGAEAPQEIAFWFKKEEIYTYPTVHDKHIV